MRPWWLEQCEHNHVKKSIYEVKKTYKRNRLYVFFFNIWWWKLCEHNQMWNSTTYICISMVEIYWSKPHKPTMEQKKLRAYTPIVSNFTSLIDAEERPFTQWLRVRTIWRYHWLFPQRLWRLSSSLEHGRGWKQHPRTQHETS